MLTILGVSALIALLIASLLVLRVKGDPMEKEDVRQYLAESKSTSAPPATDSKNQPPAP
jgi:hypothetical protein